MVDIVNRTVAACTSLDLDQAIQIEPREQVAYGFVPEDLLTACERTADHCSNAAVEMLQVSEGKLEAHVYLNALKAGELHASAAFAEQFAKYKAQYAFPEESTSACAKTRIASPCAVLVLYIDGMGVKCHPSRRNKEIQTRFQPESGSDFFCEGEHTGFDTYDLYNANRPWRPLRGIRVVGGRKFLSL